MAAHPAGSRYPDCVGVTYDETAHKVTCFYNDHSVYVWDVRDIGKVRPTMYTFPYSAPSSVVCSVPKFVDVGEVGNDTQW